VSRADWRLSTSSQRQPERERERGCLEFSLASLYFHRECAFARHILMISSKEPTLVPLLVPSDAQLRENHSQFREKSELRRVALMTFFGAADNCARDNRPESGDTREKRRAISERNARMAVRRQSLERGALKGCWNHSTVTTNITLQPADVHPCESASRICGRDLLVRSQLSRRPGRTSTAKRTFCAFRNCNIAFAP